MNHSRRAAKFLAPVAVLSLLSVGCAGEEEDDDEAPIENPVGEEGEGEDD